MPLPGVLGGPTLAALYGVDAANADMMLLLRHRAVLFGLLGGFMLLAAWRTALQPYAFAAGWISVVSFLMFAWMGGPHGAAIQRIVMADWIAVVALALGTAAFAAQHKG
ncbi:MAG: phosphopantetheine adenylyltransferase [Betaproteobacteria bacterium]|nr:phosphopantetheine adenylyltransferase [Betaproteobacteria bacterium]